jgi:hypothetical protein
MTIKLKWWSKTLGAHLSILLSMIRHLRKTTDLPPIHKSYELEITSSICPGSILFTIFEMGYH